MLALIEDMGSAQRPGRFCEELGFVTAFGMRCLCLAVHVPERSGRWRRGRAAERWKKLLLEGGADEILFHNDFAHSPLFSTVGLPTACGEYLKRAAAGEIVSNLGGERVLLTAETLEPEVIRAFSTLCGRFRYVLFHGTPQVFHILEEIAAEYGLMLMAPGGTFSDGPVLAFSSEGCPRLSDRCPTLTLDGGELRGGREIVRIVYAFPEELRAELPEGYPPLPILARAVRDGRIDPGDVGVTEAE